MVKYSQECPLGVREATRHFLLSDNKAGIKKTRGHMIPPLGTHEHTSATTDVAPHVWFSPRSSSIGKILSFHVNAIKGIRGASQDYTFDVFQVQFAGIKSHLGCLPG